MFVVGCVSFFFLCACACLCVSCYLQMLDCVRAQLPAMPSHDVALVLHTVSRLQHVTSYAW